MAKPMASNDYENLLGDFQRLPDRPERLPTLMEIAGYSHKENACSDILEFFFDPEKPHGLGTLFLDALARIGEIPNQEEVGSNVSVSREATTRTGKRIDLLVESDSHAILIENKFDSGVDNPFGEYAAHLDSLEPAGRPKHKFLLTLRPHPKDVGHGFENITHEQLVKKIRALLGDYVGDADTRYLTFLLDFLNTLDNLQRGTDMGQEFLDFLELRLNETENFLREINKFKDELRAKVNRLADLIEVECCPNVKQVPWRKKDELFDILGHHIRLASGLVVAVDTFIRLGGWKITFHVRSGGDPPELGKLLQRLEIPVEKKMEGNRFIHPDQDHFAFAADLKPIAEVVQKVVHKLATSDGAS